MPAKLDDAGITNRLESIDGWDVVDGKLHREFKFANFVEAMGFMVRAGIEAEKMNHHPEWFNVYSKVRVDLTTHAIGGLSENDFIVAAKIDEALS